MTPKHSTLIILVVAALAFAGCLVIPAESEDADTTYTVTYQVGDMTFTPQASGNTVTLKALESLVTEEALAELDGLTFLGWSTDGNVIFAAGSTYVLTENTVFEAYFAPTVYTYQFNSYDGAKLLKDTGATKQFVDGSEKNVYDPDNVEDNIIDLSEIVAAAALDTYREGYIFVGWLAAGSEEPVSTEDLGYLQGDVTYAATYVIDYSVYFIDGDKTFSMKVSTLVVPDLGERAGFTFLGWFIGTKQVDPEDFDFTEDTTFVAKWEPINCYVTFVAGEDTIAVAPVLYGETVVEPKLPVGYKAWDFDFATKIVKDTIIEAIENDPVPDVYKLTYVVDGIVIFETTTDAAVISPTDPVKEGYTFAGWDPALDVPVTEDTVYTAQFTPDVLTVTFMAGEDVYTVSSVKYGEKAIEPKLPEGYVAWDFDFDTPILADTTIYALETPIVQVFKLTYVVDGVIILETTTDSAIVVPTDPVKEGFTFSGWNPSVDKPVVADTVYTAQFRADVFTVTFMAGDKEVSKSTVEYGATVTEPIIPEGYAGWDFDFTTPIVKDTVIKAMEFVYTVKFVAGGTTVKEMTVTKGTVLTEKDMPEKVSGYKAFVPPKDPIDADTVITADREYGNDLGNPMILSAAVIIGVLVLLFLAILIRNVRSGKWIIGRAKKEAKE